MTLSLSCQPFTVTRFVARTFAEMGEHRVTEREARDDARRMIRAGWSPVEIVRVEWEAVTGIKRGGRIVGLVREAEPAS